MTFFFSFVPGGILYAYNAEQFGQVKSKHIIILPLVALMILLVTLVILVLPENFDAKSMFQSFNILFALVFYHSQKGKFKEFITTGGTLAGFKVPIIYSLIFTAILISLYFIPGAEIELKKDRIFENKQISVQVPEKWDVIRNYEENVLVEIIGQDGFASMSIDNIQYFYGAQNSEAITEYSPEELLADTLKSIEADTKADPEFGWTNFKLTEPSTGFILNGYSAARGSFSVDENVLGQGKMVNRTIARILLFTKDDIFNIVFAPTSTADYESGVKDFEKFIGSLKIK